MLFGATEVDVEFVEVLQEGAEGGAFGHLGEGVDILGEALAAIAVLAVGARNIGVGVVDVARKQHSGMYLAPVGSHLLAVLAAGVEVGDLVGPEDIVHILSQFSLQRSHHRKFLANEDLGKQSLFSGEGHGLLLEVLDIGTFAEELGHVVDLVARLPGEHITGAGQDSRAHKHRHIGKVADKLLHEAEVLCAVVLGGDMYLEERNIDTGQVIVVALGGVVDEELAVRIVVFQPILEGSADEAAADDSDVDHCDFKFKFLNLVQEV